MSTRSSDPPRILLGSSFVSIDVVQHVEDVLALPNGGWVYAIVAPEDVLRVKIGYAKDVDHRWAAIMGPIPAVVHGLHSATLHVDMRAAEKAAHRQLDHARVHGEWFDMRDYAVDQWLGSRETETVENCLHDRYVDLKRAEKEAPLSAVKAAIAAMRLSTAASVAQQG